MFRGSPVFTIGHSVHTFEYFVSLLKRWRISAIADVRSAPHSRWQPQFNRNPFQRLLKEESIAYVFLGAELGGRGGDESVFDENSRVKYQRIAASSLFLDGLERVRRGCMNMSLALMCVERDPIECHRGLLVSRYLAADGIDVLHIDADGQAETHRDAERRLLRSTGLQEPDLFRTDDELLADAYERQESKIAYVKPPSAAVGRLT